FEEADNIARQTDVTATATRSRLAILGVLRIRRGCYIMETIIGTALIRSREFTTGAAYSFLGDHHRKLSFPQRPTTVTKSLCARAIQAEHRNTSWVKYN
ncbi:hypothetical protein J6590_049975, partial [Homalodisca vitripennis]